MSTRKHLGIAILMLTAVVAVGGMFFVWPVYRKVTKVDRRAAELLTKGRNYDQRLEVINELTVGLVKARHRIEKELRQIPESPDLAGLMRVLSLPVDRVNVRDQTFTAGAAKEAVLDGDMTAMVMPLTVDMVARFDSIFDLIRATESMKRLLRITSVRITSDRQEDEDQPFAKASVVVEAVYDPPQAPEDE